MIHYKYRSSSDLSDPLTVSNSDFYPNFVKITEGYGVSTERVGVKERLLSAFKRLLAVADELYLLDVIIEAKAKENVHPMIPAGGTHSE